MILSPRQLVTKMYFYLDRGLGVLNNFKYQGAGILALYYLLKFESPVWLPVMFAVSIPVLTIVGWLWVKKMAKALDRMNTDKGTYYAVYQFRLMEEQVRLLKKLNSEPYDKESMDKLKPEQIK